ncbi:hypothetical protein Q0Z83_060160 [Actinoplanes sichuanensis]|uniref:Uncharacterized protein n=1 Tax=Actinoplanes sichuanensis TaxID=512349 RepID=A0ABW4A7B6_9ACTN|nr:hypothetical protein [Actinoplanes sichuanensis]BEL07825.1 hypothetical protein Q0Z83_060160 [Actinoplanes sichuanensis]
MSQLVVTTDIPLGDPGRGVFAFRVGDKVDETDVKQNGWEDYVSGPNTKAARQAVSTATSERE